MAPRKSTCLFRLLGWAGGSLLLLAWAAACAKKQPPAPPVSKTPPAQQAVTPPPALPVLLEEAQAVGQAFIGALSAGDLDAALALFDFSQFASQSLTAPAPAANSTAAETHELASSMAAAGVEALLQSQTAAPASWKLLRVRERDGATAAVVRSVGASGLRYYELVFARGGAEARIVDVGVFTSGERLATQIGRWLQLKQAPAAENSPPTVRLRELLERAVQTQNFELALEIFAELPESQQQQLPVQRLRLQAAQAMSSEAGAAALEELIQLFPEDSGVALQAIAIRQEQQRYPAARAAIDLVDRAVGGDPYLDVLRSQAYRGEGDFASAREKVSAALAAEPELQEAWWERVMLSLAEKKYAETAAALDEIKGRFAVTLLDLETIPDYAGFVASQEYQAWRAAGKAGSNPDQRDSQKE